MCMCVRVEFRRDWIDDILKSTENVSNYYFQRVTRRLLYMKYHVLLDMCAARSLKNQGERNERSRHREAPRQMQKSNKKMVIVDVNLLSIFYQVPNNQLNKKSRSVWIEYEKENFFSVSTTVFMTSRLFEKL